MITWLLIASYCFTTNFQQTPSEVSLNAIMAMLVIEILIEFPILYKKLILEE